MDEPDHIPSDTPMAVVEVTWAQHGWHSIGVTGSFF